MIRNFRIVNKKKKDLLRKAIILVGRCCELVADGTLLEKYVRDEKLLATMKEMRDLNQDIVDEDY